MGPKKNKKNNRTIEVKSRFKGHPYLRISHRGPTLGSGAYIPSCLSPGGLVFSKLPGSLRHHCRACGRRLVGGSDAKNGLEVDSFRG